MSLAIRFVSAAALAALTAFAAATPSRPGDGDKGPAELRAVTPDVRRTLEEAFADEKLMRLSTGDDGAANRFEILVTLAVPGNDGRRHSSHYLVARDGDEAAALVLSPRGSPFAYATTGLMAGFDPAEPGRLILSGTGAPHFRLALGEEGDNVDVQLSFDRDLTRPQFRLELAPLLRGALENAKRMDFDREKRIARFATGRSSILVVLAREGGTARFRVNGLVVKSRAGHALSLSNVRVGGKRSTILGVSKEDFLRLGLPTRVVEGEERPQVPLFVPPHFDDDEDSRRAIERVRGLFPRFSTGSTGAPGGSSDGHSAGDEPRDVR